MLERDPDRVRAIVNALSDEYSRKILTATNDEGKSPEEIASEQKIPVSTCYRRIHDLVSLSILQAAKIEIREGKKLTIYKRLYKNMLVKLEANNLVVELVPNTDSSVLTSKSVDNARIITLRDCDICMSKNIFCKLFASPNSASRFYICQQCEKRISKERENI